MKLTNLILLLCLFYYGYLKRIANIYSRFYKRQAQKIKVKKCLKSEFKHNRLQCNVGSL